MCSVEVEIGTLDFVRVERVMGGHVAVFEEAHEGGSDGRMSAYVQPVLLPFVSEYIEQARLQPRAPLAPPLDE